jgi:hypothetical protein
LALVQNSVNFSKASNDRSEILDGWTESENQNSEWHAVAIRDRHFIFRMLGRPHPKAKFTQSEDETLKDLVNELGAGDWDAIAERMAGRNPRQCRERWTFYLSPDVLNTAWTKDEETLLLEKRAELGPGWTTIALCFPGRTPISVKSRWNLIQRRRRKYTGSQLLSGVWCCGTTAPSKNTTATECEEPNFAPPTMAQAPSFANEFERDNGWQPEDDAFLFESGMGGTDDPLEFTPWCWF